MAPIAIVIAGRLRTKSLPRFETALPAAAMVAPTSLASRPGQRAFARAEVELAAARRDIDIAHAADHGLRINCRRRIVPFSQHSLAIDDDVQPARLFVRFV